MARARFAGIIAVAGLAAGLTACSSTTHQAAATPPATTSAPAPSASATATPTASATASSSTGQGSGTVGTLRAAFGSGDITVYHMPTADPAWVARVQTENQHTPSLATDPKLRNLMALVDEAAREKDTTSLARLCTRDCDAQQQAALWAKPGELDKLSSLIEHAPMGQGAILPDFLLNQADASFSNADDTAYGRLVGSTSPAGYFTKGGIWTAFQNGTGGPDVAELHWTGIKTV